MMRTRALGFALLAATLALGSTGAFAQSPPAVDQDEQVSDLLAEISYRIVNGQLAREGAWPWQVAMYFKKSNGQFGQICGGSLIHRQWVLTAAHCILSKNASSFMVVENTNRIDSPLKPGGRGRAIAVRRIITHPDYNDNTNENDIALMQLEAPAQSALVAMASSGDNAIESPGTVATVTGWGTLRAINQGMDAITNEVVRPGDPRYFTNRLMEVDLPLVDQKTCQSAYPGAKSVDARALCAGYREGGKDSCQGDSGGPLVAKLANGKYKQVGVVSWGRGCARKDSYGIYTRVSAFRTWISATSGVSFEGSDVDVGSSAPASPSPAAPPSAVPSNPGSANNTAGLSIGFEQGDTLKVGQKANIRVSTARSGSLVLVDITPDGKATQIYPNARSLTSPTGRRRDSNLISPNVPVVVPDPRNPYEGFEFTIDPPGGEGKLVAILSDRPLQSISPIPEFPKTLQGSDAGIEFFSNLTQDLQRDVVVDGVARKASWSFAIKTYQIAQ
jgi:secreted trypsin-like serine protease